MRRLHSFLDRTGFIFVFLCAGLCSPQGFAVDQKAPLIRETEWTRYRPYVPQKSTYSFELGSMWEQSNTYWLGGSYGKHVGPCVFSQSQTCQQYVDFIGGVGGRDGLTMGLALGSLRWQFIDFPSAFSPMARVFAGLMNIRDDVRDYSSFSYGVGYGWTVSVHEKVDLKIEMRVGGGDRLWSQAFFGVNLKMEKWLSYFAHRLKDLGVGTATVTGNVLRKTLKTSNEVMGEVVGKPVQKLMKATMGEDEAEGRGSDGAADEPRSSDRE